MVHMLVFSSSARIPYLPNIQRCMTKFRWRFSDLLWQVLGKKLVPSVVGSKYFPLPTTSTPVSKSIRTIVVRILLPSAPPSGEQSTVSIFLTNSVRTMLSTADGLPLKGANSDFGTHSRGRMLLLMGVHLLIPKMGRARWLRLQSGLYRVEVREMCFFFP